MIIGAIVTLLVIESLALGQSLSPSPTPNAKENTVTAQATGTFEVKLVPLTDKTAFPGRMSIEKTWHGGLDGTSTGEMMTAQTDVKDSAVYVALEKFTGTVNGKKGTFLLHHTGIMTRGTPHLSITVVPDSGTDQLESISGTLNIVISQGKHSYDFEYTLPESHQGN